MGRAGVSWDMIFLGHYCGFLGMFMGSSWDVPGTFLEGSWNIPSQWNVSQPGPGVAAKRTGWAVPGMARRDPEGLGKICFFQ